MQHCVALAEGASRAAVAKVKVCVGLESEVGGLNIGATDDRHSTAAVHGVVCPHELELSDVSSLCIVYACCLYTLVVCITGDVSEAASLSSFYIHQCSCLRVLN